MPIRKALVEVTGETAHLSHLVGGRLLTLAFAYSSRHGMKVMMEDADILPFHATASGLAVLAVQPGPVTDESLSVPLPRLTASTLTDPDMLRARIARAKANGYSKTHSTSETDVQGFAVPLFDAMGTCSGSLAVAAAAPRMTPALHNLILTELTRAGAEVTAAWGGHLPADLATLRRNAA